MAVVADRSTRSLGCIEKAVPISHTCPKCGNPISWVELRDKFACRRCSAQLMSSAGTVFLWATVILGWPMAILAAFGVWQFIAGLIVAGILSFAISAAGSTVSVDRGSDAT